MKITKRQLRRMIQEELIVEQSEFASTAEEEAKKINAQTGSGYVTDQAFWEKQGVVTGEDLALSVLDQTYSDFYKDVHGFRPRHAPFETVDEYTIEINKLDDYYASIAAEEQIDVERQKRIEQERQELASMMPGEFDFEQLPMASGMGRRVENKMIITKKRLTRIIREAILSEAEGDLSNAELAKELKGGASDIASSVPAALNDELARIIQTLTAMAQFDKAKFEKMVGYADNLGAKALEKAQKGEKPEEGEAA
jgi:hypothetical protein